MELQGKERIRSYLARRQFYTRYDYMECLLLPLDIMKKSCLHTEPISSLDSFPRQEGSEDLCTLSVHPSNKQACEA
ncbi:mCG1044630, isoform CRA_a [Mus musculus]|nr:mCG1044630, isoform CRA_a [Mus musculus]